MPAIEKKVSGAAKIAVIIPAYNEEKTIGGVISGIKQVLPYADIVVIVDKSKDQTVKIAQDMGATVIRLPLKMGMGCAVQAGCKYACRKGYDFLIRMDSDGQHVPAEINKLLLPVLQKGADLTIGSRYLDQTDYRSPFVRRGVMVFLAYLVSWIYGKKFTDTTSGFKAMNRNVIKFLAEHYPSIGGTPTLIVLKWAGFSIKEVPVFMRQRETGDSYFTSTRKIAYMSRVLVELLALLVKRKNTEFTQEVAE